VPSFLKVPENAVELSRRLDALLQSLGYNSDSGRMLPLSFFGLLLTNDQCERGDSVFKNGLNAVRVGNPIIYLNDDSIIIRVRERCAAAGSKIDQLGLDLRKLRPRGGERSENRA
jgi:hypothetical protein